MALIPTAPSPRIRTAPPAVSPGPWCAARARVACCRTPGTHGPPPAPAARSAPALGRAPVPHSWRSRAVAPPARSAASLGALLALALLLVELLRLRHRPRIERLALASRRVGASRQLLLQPGQVVVDAHVPAGQ